MLTAILLGLAMTPTADEPKKEEDKYPIRVTVHFARGGKIRDVRARLAVDEKTGAIALLLINLDSREPKPGDTIVEEKGLEQGTVWEVQEVSGFDPTICRVKKKPPEKKP